MTALTLESLGLTKDEIIDRVIDKISDSILTTISFDEDGNEFVGKSNLSKRLQEMVAKRIDAFVSETGEKHLLPKVEAMAENLVLQSTNQWGERTGTPMTFTEYMVKKADEWITEKVDYNGKTKSEAGSFGWSGTQTRVAHMIHKHFHYEIEKAMKEAMASANKSIANGLHETVLLKINEVAGKLKVEVRS